MTLLVVLASILFLFLLLLILPIGVQATMDTGQLSLLLRYGPLRFSLYPRPKKKKPPRKKKTKTKQEKKKKKTEADETGAKAKKKKVLSLALVRGLLSLAFDTLGRFFSRLRISRLELALIWAGEDPADTAARYGYLSAGIYSLLALMQRRCRFVRPPKTELSLDFCRPQPVFSGTIHLSIRLGSLLAIGLGAAFRALRLYLSLRPKREEPTPVKNNSPHPAPSGGSTT